MGEFTGGKRPSSPLVLKARATTMPCFASWLSGDAALYCFPGICECCYLSVDAIFDTICYIYPDII